LKYTVEQLNALELNSGDIGATQGNFPMGNLQQLIFTPSTDRYHFLLVLAKNKANEICHFLHLPLIKGTWAAVESIGRGVTVSELTKYAGTDIKFYRVDCDEEIRKKAPVKLAGYSRSGYDYKLFIRLLLRIVALEWKSLFTTGRLRKLEAREMPCDTDSEFICTEGADEGYDDAGYHLLPINVLGIPSAFKEAELAGRMEEITLWGRGRGC